MKMKKCTNKLYFVLCTLVLSVSFLLPSCSGCSKVPDAGEAMPLLLPAGESMTSLEDTLLWGYIDIRGEWAIPPKFEDAMQFTPDGYACVTYQGRLCWVDEYGSLHYAPDELTWQDGFYNGYAHVGVWDKDTMFNLYGVIDTTFQYVVPPVNDNVEGYDYEPIFYDDNYFLNVGEWYCTAEWDSVGHFNTFRWHTPDGEVIYEWQWPF